MPIVDNDHQDAKAFFKKTNFLTESHLSRLVNHIWQGSKNHNLMADQMPRLIHCYNSFNSIYKFHSKPPQDNIAALIKAKTFA